MFSTKFVRMINDGPKFYLKLMYDPKENFVRRNQSQLNILHMEQRFDFNMTI